MEYQVVQTQKGKLIVKPDATVINPENLCQCCNKILSDTDLLDYICNSCYNENRK